jgi:hypothetical protein
MASTDPRTNPFARDLLIEHLDGHPVTLVRRTRDPESTFGERISLVVRRRLIQAMVDRQFLTPRICEDGIGMETVITQKGRAALAAALGDWADALCRAEANAPALLWCDPPRPRWSISK